MTGSKYRSRACSTALLALIVASGAEAGNISFTYDDPSLGNLVASFTLDVSGGVAISGSGTISSSYLPGTETLTLLTQNTVFPDGFVGTTGSINNTGPGSDFTWHTVPNTGGIDLIGDSVVNSTAPYFDANGPIFAISNASNTIIGGINIWANSSSPASLFSDALGTNGTCYGECYGGTGSATLTPVPVPAALPLLLSGLGLCSMRRRRPRQWR